MLFVKVLTTIAEWLEHLLRERKIRSSRTGSSQTNDFKIGAQSFPARRWVFEGLVEGNCERVLNQSNVFIFNYVHDR